MSNKKIVFLFTGIIFTFIIYGTSIFAASEYIDDDGNYYPQTYDQLPVWQLCINHLGLVNDVGSEVVVVNSPTGNVNIADPDIAAGGIAGYWAQDLSISPGTYTQAHIIWDADNIFTGCIYDPVEEKYRATPNGTLYDSKEEALNNASSITIAEEEDYEEYLQIYPQVTIGEGERFTLTILWKNYGLEADDDPVGDFGVGLVWDPDESEFKLGMQKDSLILE